MVLHSPVLRLVSGCFPLILLAGLTSPAFAQDPSTPASFPEMPAAAEPVAPAATVTAPVAPGGPRYGGAGHFRLVSVPSWFLNLFTKVNVPLSSYGFRGEFYRRKGEMDIVLGLGYQKMGPPDGNWLGKGKKAELDTDLVQFRGFGFLGADALFLWRTDINQYLAFHYGAGVGFAIVTGTMYRISAGGCTEQNAADESKCFPTICTASGCTEKALKDSEGPGDSPATPHRFVESDVPGAIPTLHMLLGFDIRIPEAKGLEFRIDGGWSMGFIVGTSVGYLF